MTDNYEAAEQEPDLVTPCDDQPGGLPAERYAGHPVPDQWTDEDVADVLYPLGCSGVPLFDQAAEQLTPGRAYEEPSAEDGQHG